MEFDCVYSSGGVDEIDAGYGGTRGRLVSSFTVYGQRLKY
jgi:hypothetical protein